MNKTEEKELLVTPVFSVVRKSFENTPFKAYGLNCKDWVMLIAHDTRISNGPVCCFVRQTRWGCEGETVEFPCGTVEPGETPVEAAIREFEEETGIALEKGSTLNLLGSFNPNPAYFNNHMHVFSVYVPDLLEKFRERGEQNLDKDEDCKVFVSRLSQQYKKLKKNAISLCALQLLGVCD